VKGWSWPSIVPPDPEAPTQTLLKRLLWMAGIWTASVLALLAVAKLLRSVLQPPLE
jgi:hypothetical protein